MKSTIEIKTAFEGFAKWCKWYMPECIEVNKADCENRFLCEKQALMTFAVTENG